MTRHTQREGYTRTGRKLPEKKCCICGVLMGYASWNSTDDHTTKPCDKCSPIFERKEKAKEIRNQRYKKKRLRELAKRLFAHEAETGDREWTPMRYVSDAELSEMRQRCFDAMWGSKPSNSDGLWVPVVRGVGWGPVIDFYIKEAGFYRVEEPSDDVEDPSRHNYEIACRKGLPTSYQSLWSKMVSSDEEIDRKKEARGALKRMEA